MFKWAIVHIFHSAYKFYAPGRVQKNLVRGRTWFAHLRLLPFQRHMFSITEIEKIEKSWVKNTPFLIGRQIFTGVLSLQLGTAKLLAYTEAMKSESNKILEIFPILLSAVNFSLGISINGNFQMCIFLLISVLFLCVNDVRHFFIYFLHFLT